MKNIYEVIRQKESEIQQLQRDIETLRAAARILGDEIDRPAEAPLAKTSTGVTPVIMPPVGRNGGSVTSAQASDGTYSAARDNTVRQFP